MLVRKIGDYIKLFLQNLSAWLVCLFALTFLAASNAVVFTEFEGRREFYIGSTSSQSRIQRMLYWRDLGNVKGESVVFFLSKGVDPREAAERIAALYQAEILFVETANDVCSFYAYSPLWWKRMMIGGVAVNLHIAVDRESGRCVIGNPIVFGGF